MIAIKLHDDAFLLQREVKIYNYLWKYKKQGHVRYDIGLKSIEHIIFA